MHDTSSSRSSRRVSTDSATCSPARLSRCADRVRGGRMAPGALGWRCPCGSARAARPRRARGGGRVGAAPPCQPQLPCRAPRPRRQLGEMPLSARKQHRQVLQTPRQVQEAPEIAQSVGSKSSSGPPGTNEPVKRAYKTFSALIAKSGSNFINQAANTLCLFTFCQSANGISPVIPARQKKIAQMQQISVCTQSAQNTADFPLDTAIPGQSTWSTNQYVA